SNAATDTSSSIAGQWMPMPGPTSSHRRRSAAVAAAKRGYQASGTDTTRPSRSSTTSAPLVTFTAVASGVADAADVLMPSPLDCSLVRPNQRRYRREFSFREAVVVFQAHRVNPVLRRLPVARNVHMDGF